MSLTEKDKEILQIIQEQNEVLLSDLPDIADCSTGKASQASRKLEEQNLIKREKTTVNGSSTYILKPKHAIDELNYDLLISDGLMPPTISSDNVQPDDDRLTHWIINLENEYNTS